MVKWLRWAAVVLGGIAVVAGAAGYGVYRAATMLPEDYRAALEVDQEQLDEQRKELEGQLTALYSQAAQDATPAEPRPRKWEAAVTDDQINGWLATRLQEELPEAAEQGLVDPRVMFADDGLTLAFRMNRGRVNAVVRFHVAPFVTEDGELGIELSDTRIGAVPLPTSRIVEVSRPLLAQAGLPLQWGQVGGRPALLVDFEQLASDARNRRTLSDIQYSEGNLYVAGQTERRVARVAMSQSPPLGVTE